MEVNLVLAAESRIFYARYIECMLCVYTKVENNDKLNHVQNKVERLFYFSNYGFILANGVFR